MLRQKHRLWYRFSRSKILHGSRFILYTIFCLICFLFLACILHNDATFPKWNSCTNVKFFVCFFFLKFLEDMNPFCDTPVLEFWWRLLWVSKPEWVLPYLSLVEAYALHIPWDLPLMWHLPTSWWPAWQPSHLFHIPARHWWDLKLGAIMPPLTVWDQADTLPTELSRLGCANVKLKN